MVENLSAMGADVTETEDGMIIHGGRPLHGAVIESHLDHRIAHDLCSNRSLRRRRYTDQWGRMCKYFLSPVLPGS